MSERRCCSVEILTGAVRIERVGGDGSLGDRIHFRRGHYECSVACRGLAVYYCSVVLGSKKVGSSRAAYALHRAPHESIGRVRLHTISL